MGGVSRVSRCSGAPGLQDGFQASLKLVAVTHRTGKGIIEFVV